MSKYILKKRIQKMAKYAHSIERGNKALYDFMYEACEMILNHAEDAKKALQIDNDIEKGIIEYFFPKKQMKNLAKNNDAICISEL